MDIQIIDCLPSVSAKSGNHAAKNHAPDRSALRKRFCQLLPDAAYLLPNVDLAYFAAVLREQKHNVFLATEAPKPADFHFLSVNLHNWQESIVMAEHLKERFNGKVGMFGNFVSARPACFSESADHLFHGEIERIAMDWNLEDLPEQNIRCGYVHDLDLLPYPAWDLFPVKQYRSPIVQKKGAVLPLLASRGCAYRCSVCPSRVNCDYRLRPAGHLMEEINYLQERFQISGFVCLDPNFAISEARLFEFCELLIMRAKDLRFSIRTHCSNFTLLMLDKLGPAGLNHLEIEIHPQSECFKGENFMEGAQEEHVRRIVDACHSMAIRVSFYYLLDALRVTDDDYDRIFHYEQIMRPEASFVLLMAPFAEEVCGAYVSQENGVRGLIVDFLERNASPFSIHILRQQPYISYIMPLQEFGTLKELYTRFLSQEAGSIPHP